MANLHEATNLVYTKQNRQIRFVLDQTSFS